VESGRRERKGRLRLRREEKQSRKQGTRGELLGSAACSDMSCKLWYAGMVFRSDCGAGSLEECYRLPPSFRSCLLFPRSPPSSLVLSTCWQTATPPDALHENGSREPSRGVSHHW